MTSNIKIRKYIAGLLCAAALMLTACSDSGTASSEEDNSSSAVTAAPKVTLSSSQEDSSEVLSSDDSSDIENKGEITPLMWEITSSDGTKITMMGSMHALKDEVYPLPDSITQAYENAEILAVECDISQATSNFTVQMKQLEHLKYKDGTTIKDHLPQEIYDGVCEFVEACGADIRHFEKYQLWALASNLEMLSAAKSDIKASNGIDAHLLDMAHDDGKEIYEVESVEFQTDLLINLPEETYQAILSGYSAETKDEALKSLSDTYEAWKTGDYDFFAKGNDIDAVIEEAEKAGEEVSDEDVEILRDYNQKLLFDRNITMKNAVEKLLDGDKDVFYVVGVAHFAGEGGIIDLLEKDGYTVTQIQGAS